MSRRIVLVLATLFCLNTLLSVFSSCRPKRSNDKVNSCNTSACFVFQSATVMAFNNATKTNLQASSNSVKATDLALQVALEGNTTVCYKRTPAKWYERMSLISPAYAYAPPMPCLIKQGGDSIIAYNIYSDKDYDQAHPAGTSLNDIITTDDIPSQPLFGQYSSNNIMVLDLLVDKAPESSGQGHKFTIVLTQKDGETISVTTEPITLLL